MRPQPFPHLDPVPSCGGDVLPGGSAVFPVIPIFFFPLLEVVPVARAELQLGKIFLGLF